MKIELEPKEKKYVYASLFLLLIIIISSFQYYRTKNLKESVKNSKKQIEILEVKNTALMKGIKLLNVEKSILSVKADSLEKQENYYKNKYYVTNEKLKKTLSDYNSSNNDGKNQLFTNAINN